MSEEQRVVTMDPAVQKAIEVLTAAVTAQCQQPPAADFELVHFIVVALPVGKALTPSEDIMPGVITTFGQNPAAMTHAAMMLLLELAGSGEFREYTNVQH